MHQYIFMHKLVMRSCVIGVENSMPYMPEVNGRNSQNMYVWS